MKAKFKVGDKVRILDGRNIHNYFGGFAYDMRNYVGEIVTINEIRENSITGVFGYRMEEVDYCWDERGLELVTNKNDCIVIYRKGNETIALDKSTGKKAVAKCSPEDTYDFYTGAQLAFERLTGAEKKPEAEPEKQPYNGKMVCIEVNNHNKNNYTKGKVYEFKNGAFKSDTGYEMDNGGRLFYSFEEWEEWTSCKFIEIKE